MGVGDVVAAVAAAIALLALGLSVFSAWRTERLATSDYQAKQQVKVATAELLATLRGFMYKGVLYTQQDSTLRDDSSSSEYVNIAPEREALNKFTLSATAIAFHSFLAARSRDAGDANVESEPWRAFFLEVGQLMQTTNPWAAAQRAAAMERLLTRLTKNDLRNIAGYLDDLPEAVHTLLASREHDVVATMLVDRMLEGSRVGEAELMPFLTFLRDVKQITDPDVDLFLAISADDVSAARTALEEGANPNVSSAALVERYSSHVDEFRSSRS